MIANTKFKLVTSPFIEAFDGAANMSRLAFRPVDQFLNIPLDSNENLDFDEALCTRIDVRLNGTTHIISSTDDDVTWSKGDVHVKFGAFGLSKGSWEYTLLAYFGSDTTEGVVLSYDNRVNFNPK